jgi:hypothetical protein
MAKVVLPATSVPVAAGDVSVPPAAPVELLAELLLHAASNSTAAVTPMTMVSVRVRCMCRPSLGGCPWMYG